MIKTNIDEIVKLATQYTREGIPWHHHFLTLNCRFNTSGKYQIILENEKTKEVFYAEFDYKPMNELERLENLFFGRK